MRKFSKIWNFEIYVVGIISNNQELIWLDDSTLYSEDKLMTINNPRLKLNYLQETIERKYGQSEHFDLLHQRYYSSYLRLESLHERLISWLEIKY